VIDPRVFRDADAYAAARQRLLRRDAGLAPMLEELRAMAERRRKAIAEGDELKAQLNAGSKKVGELKKAGGGAAALMAEMAALSDRAKAASKEAEAIDADFHAALLHIPNIPADDIADGGEDAHEIVRVIGTPAVPQPWHRPHWETAASLGLLDLERGSKIAGSGFPLYTGMGARLERALINWLLDTAAREHGYTEVATPLLVTRQTMTGTGQLPKFEEDLYRTEPDGLFLVPTAEVPVTNIHRGEILTAEQLPIRYCAYTPCFRREAGSAGKDTRGILRVHQFDKVELVWLTAPDASEAALATLTGHAELALQRLGLAYRVLRLAAGDFSFASHRTYDLEVWAPGVGKWLEVSSCSTFTDFQARRLDIRFRREAGAKPEFVHTLNGSQLGLARVLIAVIENGLQADGSVIVPEVLRPFMGVDRIGPGRA
jgi:seryl-tRNA synthetase